MNEARAPTDEKTRQQVLKEYKNGVGPKALAEKYGISINTIKSWIKREKAKAEKSAPPKKKSAPQKKKAGAPKGNTNAVGHGAPVGNTNALKHGGYSQIYWDSLDEEEKELIEDMPTDDEELLIQQIQLFSVRERRLMKIIKQYKEMKGGLYISGVATFEEKRKFKDEEEEQAYTELIAEKVKNGERLPGSRTSSQTNTGSTIDLITRLEKELTSVQSKKTKAIDALAKLHLEKQKLAGETKGNELVKTWAESVMKARRGNADG